MNTGTDSTTIVRIDDGDGSMYSTFSKRRAVALFNKWKDDETCWGEKGQYKNEFQEDDIQDILHHELNTMHSMTFFMKYTTWTCAEYNSVIYPREKEDFLIIANEVIALKLTSKDRKRLSHLRKTEGWIHKIYLK